MKVQLCESFPKKRASSPSQDKIGLSYDNIFEYFMLADGTGNDGEFIAEYTLLMFPVYFKKFVETQHNIRQSITQSISKIQEGLLQTNYAGTTTFSCVITDNKKESVIATYGNSRIHFVKNGTPKRELVENGKLSFSLGKNDVNDLQFSENNIVFNYLPQNLDNIIITSDGVTGEEAYQIFKHPEYSQEDIKEIIGNGRDDSSILILKCHQETRAIFKEQTKKYDKNLGKILIHSNNSLDKNMCAISHLSEKIIPKLKNSIVAQREHLDFHTLKHFQKQAS